MSAPWLELAKREIGVYEVAGDGSNPVILDYAKEAHIKGYSTDSIAWCAVFWCAMNERAGIRSTRSAWARDALAWGKKCAPTLGCTVIFDRGLGRGHVGFFIRLSADGKRVLVLGGNQSDRVIESWYPVDRVLGYRWPDVVGEAATDKTTRTQKTIQHLQSAGSRTIDSALLVNRTIKVVATGGAVVKGVEELTDASVLDPASNPVFTMPAPITPGIADTIAQIEQTRWYVLRLNELASWCWEHWWLAIGVALLIILSANARIICARVDDHLSQKNTGRPPNDA